MWFSEEGSAGRARPDGVGVSDPHPGRLAGGEIVAIQYLRGIAAGAVLLYHVVLKLWGMGYRGYDFEWLQAGVDIFFIISGFIMWYAQARQPGRGAVDFLKDRVARVVPLYWALTIGVAALLLVIPSLFGSSKFDLTHIASSLLFIPAEHPVSGGYFPLVILGWTLNYEMFFYLLFAIAIALSGGSPRRRLIVAALPLLALVLLRPFFHPVGIERFYANNIVIEFVYGMVLAVAFLSGRIKPSRWWWLVAVAGLTALVMIKFSPPSQRGWLYGLPSLAIVAGLVFAPAPRLPALKFLGDVSYSLYLTHFVVLAAVAAAWQRAGLGGGVTGKLLFVPFACAVTVASAWVSWRLIEQPGTRWARRLFKRQGTARRAAPSGAWG